MSRGYDSSRRKEQARLTRRRILDAAVEMHRQGITAYEPLAAAAGVSVATVRKHFPNKEQLFQGCTQHFFASVAPPQLAPAAELADPRARTEWVAREICRLHEASHELIFLGEADVTASPALAGAVAEYARIVGAAVDLIVGGPGLAATGAERDATRARVRGLLDPFTYRAFRFNAGFDPEAARRELTRLVTCAIGLPPHC